MIDHERGQVLLGEMVANPQEFDESGKPHELLQHYFAGLPVDTLRPMLRSGNVHVQRGASFIASELGAMAAALVDDVTPLVDSADRHTQWYSLEVLALCGTGPAAEKFTPVVRCLDSSDAAIRGLAERLVARADASQLLVTRRYFEERGRLDDARRWTAR